MTTLATFAADLRLDDVPPHVTEIARRHILDTIGVIAGGVVDPVTAQAKRRPAGPSWSPVGRKAPKDAAFLNGVAGTWLDFDLGHRWSGGHPAIHVLPAALAVAEERDLSGADLLAAFIAGCEVAARVGLALGALAPGLHPHGSWPVFGAVAAVGRLRGLDAAAIERAFDLVSTLTLVTSWRTAFAGATVRNVYAGYGAELAVEAIDLVEDGWEGEANGMQVVFGGIAAPKLNPRRATVALGSRWDFAESYYKPYSFARFGHAAIDILQTLNGSFTADDVEVIDIGTYALGAAMAEKNPASELQARFSTPWAVASWLVNGSSGPDDFRGAALDDSRRRDLAKRVTVRLDSGWDGLNPAWRGASMKVTLRDGRVIQAEADQTRGEPEHPIGDDALFAKFDSLLSPSIGAALAAKARESWLSIDTTSARDLTALLPAG